jgi:hypothetical protein
MRGLRSTQAKQGQDRHDHHDKSYEIDDLVHCTPLFKTLVCQRSNANEVPQWKLGNQAGKDFVDPTGPIALFSDEKMTFSDLTRRRRWLG